MPIKFKSRLFLAAALGTAAYAAPAQAKWETVHGFAIKPGGTCGSPHDRNPSLRASDGRPFDVPAGFNGEIEIYGDGIDFSKDITATGLPGLSATMPRKVGGPENLVRGCGAIGSAVVQLVVNPNTAGATGSLRIGDEVVPLRIVNASIDGAAWSEATNRNAGSGVGSGGGGGGQPGISNGPLTADNSGGNGCGVPVCPQGNNGAQVSGDNNMSRREPVPNYPAGIGGCIGDSLGRVETNVPFGGRDGGFPTTLTVTLPIRRDGSTLTCLTRAMIFEVRGKPARGDVGGFRAPAGFGARTTFAETLLPPRYTGATAGLLGPTVRLAPDVKVQTLNMTPALAQAFVGERTITLTSPAPGANPLTLVLRSNPYNGIRSIQGVPFTGGRISSTFDVRFDFLAAFRGPENVGWQISAVTGAAPATCFAAVSGTAIATSAIGKISLTATEAAGCNGSTFKLEIAPAINPAQAAFSAPFVRSATFTLPARSVPVQTSLPQQRPSVPPR